MDVEQLLYSRMFILIRRKGVFTKSKSGTGATFLDFITPDRATPVTMDVATCPLRCRSISQPHVHRGEDSLLEANL